ncbi:MULTISPECIES: hypothetical protein [unclassified Psychrobacter]|uniref:hypothetical protein n=1 Tax=unclassified Psychrobacter TaxID=196806 RepID=UPI0004113A40|nr:MULTISPECIES: hypothetical protein [unclassified Psychrobacter]
MFDIVISVDDNKVLGKIAVDSYFFEPSKYEYAYYLYKNGERIDTVWYTKNMEVAFALKDMTGVFFVKAFIKDIEHGDTRNYNSEKMSIDS